MRIRDEKGAFCEYTYDANDHMTRMFHQAGVSHITTLYTYDKDGREQTAKVRGGYTKTTSYDKYGRTSGITLSTKKNFGVRFVYPSASGNQERALPSSMTAGQRTLRYQYDQNGNITSIQETPGSGGAVKTDTFQYDERNQLIRENSQTQNKTFVYEYDEGGNMTAVKEYAYTTASSLPAAVKTATGRYDTAWKDKLLNWDGTPMAYDSVGNMVQRGDTSYTWDQGRKLTGVDNGKKIQYSYDHTGARVKKVVDGVTTEYRMAGDLLVSEITNGQTFWYHYDSGANLISIVIGGKNYFYVRNLQNDVIALVDEDGNEVVHYTYDSWGKILSITGSLKDTVGQQNPFRYRGYFYDRETGMYYLKSRYYDPELRRFISADVIATVKESLETLHNRNLYAYCDGNPLTRRDDNGKMWLVAAAAFAVGTVASVATQMMGGKSFKEVSWIGAVTSGLTTAMGLLGVAPAAQIAISVAGEFVSSYIEDDESLYNSVVNAAVEGAYGAIFDKAGKILNVEGYLKLTRDHKHNIKKIKDLNLWLYKENRKISSENVRYAGEMIKSTATTVVNYGISTTTSPAVKSAFKAKREKGLRLVFMNGEINWIY